MVRDVALRTLVIFLFLKIDGEIDVGDAAVSYGRSAGQVGNVLREKRPSLGCCKRRHPRIFDLDSHPAGHEYR